MKIRVEHVTHEDVYLTDKQMKEVTQKYLRSKFNLSDGCYIKKKYEIWHKVDYSTSHSYTVDELYRDAKDIDHAVLKVLKAL